MRAYAAQRGLYMKIIKRNGSEVDFDITKIIVAVTKANDVVPENERMTPMQIQRIAQSVELACQKVNRAMSVALAAMPSVASKRRTRTKKRNCAVTAP